MLISYRHSIHFGQLHLFGLVQSTQVPLSPNWSNLVHFSPIRSIRSIRFTSVYFGPFSVSLDCGRLHVLRVYVFFLRSHALFTGPTSTKSGKINFKTRSHSTIHTFKNYFATVFSVISFQFSIISGIQIEPQCTLVNSSCLDNFSPIWSIWSNLVHFVHVGLFCPFGLFQITSVNCNYKNERIQVWVESIINYLSNINCNYIISFD